VLEGNRAYVPVLYVFNKMDVSSLFFSTTSGGALVVSLFRFRFTHS
jgi:hypothetical protein